MVSKSSQYALRAGIYIASRHGEEKHIGMKEIAEAIEAPTAFTAKVMQVLTKNDIISAVRGAKGGFYMEGYQLKQPILNIVQAVEGVDTFTSCGLGLKHCSNKNPCPIHDSYQDVRTRMLKLFQKTSVKMLADKHNRGMKLIDTISNGK